MKLLFLWCQYLSLFFQFHSSKNISLRKLLAVIRTESYLTGFYPGEDLLASIISLDLVLPKPFTELFVPDPVRVIMVRFTLKIKNLKVSA